MPITSESIKFIVRSRLIAMAESRHEILNHASILTALGVSVNDSRFYIGACIEEVTGHYIDNLCRELTTQYSNGTPAIISINSEMYKLIVGRHRNESFAERFWDHPDGDFSKDKALIEVYISEVDFEKIAESINSQAANLANAGLNLLAKKIIDRLNLAYMDRGYSPYRKSSRIICNTWSFNYHEAHSKIIDLMTLQNALGIIENDSGVFFGTAIADYISAARELSWQQEKMPSRSVFGKGGHLEIYIFKDKHEFRFSVSAFDAVVAFLTINGESDTADKIIDTTGLMEAA